MAAAYICNRCPTAVLNGKSPMETVLKKPVPLDQLRVFGCKAHILMPKERRQKLDATTRSGIFVGYRDGGSYRFRVPNGPRRELAVSRDAAFYEKQFLTADQNEILIRTDLSQPSDGDRDHEGGVVEEIVLRQRDSRKSDLEAVWTAPADAQDVVRHSGSLLKMTRVPAIRIFPVGRLLYRHQSGTWTRLETQKCLQQTVDVFTVK